MGVFRAEYEIINKCFDWNISIEDLPGLEEIIINERSPIVLIRMGYINHYPLHEHLILLEGYMYVDNIDNTSNYYVYEIPMRSRNIWREYIASK
jgi:hypothetical protein